MWMLIDIFKSCTQTPKLEKLFWKSQGILKSWNAGHTEIAKPFFCKTVLDLCRENYKKILFYSCDAKCTHDCFLH